MARTAADRHRRGHLAHRRAAVGILRVMSRLIIAVTACALAGVAVVAGCGSDDGPSAETAGAGGDPEGIALVERVNRYYGEAAELNLELGGGEGGGAVTGRYLLVGGEIRAAIVDLDPLTIVATPAGSFIAASRPELLGTRAGAVHPALRLPAGGPRGLGAASGGRAGAGGAHRPRPRERGAAHPADRRPGHRADRDDGRPRPDDDRPRGRRPADDPGDDAPLRDPPAG